MKLHLLGYSESSLARIMDVLWMQGWREEVVIVQNQDAEEKYPFAHPGLPYHNVMWQQWQFDAQQHCCLPAVTGVQSKWAVFRFFQTHCGVEQKHYTQVIHPGSIISETATIGLGCFIEPGSIITSFARLSFGVSINRGVTIGHHTTLGDFVTLNPGVHVAGHCSIGNGVQIGIGSVVFNGVRIGSGSIIGGGSVVTKDIPDNVVAWGNPCNVIKPVNT